jgi:hypothetical protein
MTVEGPWKKPFDPYAEFEEGSQFERTKLLNIGLLDFEELQNKEKRDYVRDYLNAWCELTTDDYTEGAHSL